MPCAMRAYSASGSSPPPNTGDPIVVAQDGSGDFETITDGVVAAVAGDTVLVRPGTYAEALTLQLLCAAIGSLCALSDEPDVEYSDRALRCLHAARELLMKQFAPPPTIRELARAVGMSDAAITRDFKAVFGESVIDFSLRCRMQHALGLLRDKRWPVARVGEAIGYTHPTSFATAFRRHFGMRPIDVRHVKDPERAGTKRDNA